MNHPAIDEVRSQVRRLHLFVTPGVLGHSVASFKSKQITRMLRVEVSRQAIAEFGRDLKANGFDMRELYEHLHGQREGPFTIEGVAYYEVASLPAPGWRVINPMIDESG